MCWLHSPSDRTHCSNSTSTPWCFSHAAPQQQLLQTQPDNTGRLTHTSVSRSSKTLKTTDFSNYKAIYNWFWFLSWGFVIIVWRRKLQVKTMGQICLDLLAYSLRREQDLPEIKLNSREVDSFSADDRFLSKFWIASLKGGITLLLLLFCKHMSSAEEKMDWRGRQGIYEYYCSVGRCKQFRAILQSTFPSIRTFH